MARGFMSGVLWGGVLGLGVSGAMSVLAPLPVAPEIADAAPLAGPVPAVAALSEDIPTPGALRDTAPVAVRVAPQADVPQTDTVVGLSTDATRSVALPQTGAAAGGLATPVDSASHSDLRVAPVAPVIANPQALAPMAPQPVDRLAINTQPAARPAPSRAQIAGSFESPVQPAPLAAQAATPEVLSTVAFDAGISGQAPLAPTAPLAAGSNDRLALSTQPAPLSVATRGINMSPDYEIRPVDPPVAGRTQTRAGDVAIALGTAPEIAAPRALGADPLPALAQASARPLQVRQDVASQDQQDQDVVTRQITALESVARPVAAPRSEGALARGAGAQDNSLITAEGTEPALEEITLAQADQTQSAPLPAATGTVVRRAIGTPSRPLTERDNGVVINRPAATPDQSEETAQAQPVAVVDDTAEDSDTSAQTPFQKHAQVFENADEKPLMSIVLIDDGSSEIAGEAGIEALSSFPYALSFAVDTSLLDAPDRMAIYRAQGFEVMALIDLPEGALPTDAENTLGVILPRMDEVVGVLEGTRGGLQGSRDVADQVTAILAQSGHGLLTQDKGLNTMPKLAVKEGVPAAPIFRDLDSKGQSSQVMRRFLDQAAFRAGQEGAVVMLGRLRPDTVSALLLWGLQDRAGTVALAPISAALKIAQ